VALSLGQGSILLLGRSEEEEPRPELPRHEARGLVQLRLVLVEEEAELQEASLYVAEGATDPPALPLVYYL
jgi:hypothetical protein